MSSYICRNPHCKGRRRRFVTDKSFGMHLQKSTSCWHFFRSRMSAGDHSDAEFDHRLIGSVPNLGIAEDTNACYSSSQRFVPLRCDFVNDDLSTSSAHLFDNASFPVPPHVSHQIGTLPQPPVFFSYSTQQKWTVALLKLLDDMNAPYYAFQAILTWARSAIAEGFSFQPESGKTRSQKCGATVCNDE